jgi:hypothetical protein
LKIPNLNVASNKQTHRKKQHAAPLADFATTITMPR